MKSHIFTWIFLFGIIAATANATEDESLSDEELTAFEEPEEEIWKDPLLVSLADFGELRGVEDVSSNGKTFYSFLGIPYATPPTGKLRFKDPTLHTGFEGIRNCTSMPEPCPQFDLYRYIREPFADYMGQEDCLYLNVFTPKTHSKKLLPVLVYLHGGGYISGGASNYLPHHIMNEEVILVVIQSRLGILGFLSTEDEVMPGNLGLKDQTLAFRWIARYIEDFSGDSLKTTLFGNSAGGSSAHLHSLSHHNLGFFKRVILQSGNALCPWAMGGVHKEVAFHLGKKFCPPKKVKEETKEEEQSNDVEDIKEKVEEETEKIESINEESAEEARADKETDIADEEKGNTSDKSEAQDEKSGEEQNEAEMSSEELLDCLQNVDTQELAMSVVDYFNWVLFPIIFGPRVDGNFLMGSPEWLLKEMRHKRMEMIIGVTKEDGGFMTQAMYSNEGRKTILQHQFPLIGPISMEFTNDDFAPFNMSIKIYDRYNGGIKTENENAANLTRMFTDRHFGVPSDTAAFLHYNSNLAKKLPIYFYEFNHRGQVSSGDMFENGIGKDWVIHTDELLYLFPVQGSAEDVELSDEDRKVSEAMVKMWVNFADTGNPTPEGSNLGFTWDPFTPESPHHLVISTESKMEDDTRNETRQFWNSMPTRQNIFLYEENFPEIMAYKRKTENSTYNDGDATSPVKDEL